MTFLNQERVIANIKSASKEVVVSSFTNHCRTIYKDSVNLSALRNRTTITTRVVMVVFPRLRYIVQELSLMPIDPRVIEILIDALIEDAKVNAKLIRKYM